MSDQLEVVLLFAAPRTGSTNLMKELAKLDGVVALDEVFHPQLTHSLSANCKKFIAQKIPCKDKNYAHKYPVKVIERIVDFYKKTETKVLVLSVFPGHLGSRVIFGMFQTLPVKVLFMQRRPVDMFISQQKANKTKKYASIDTTELKVDINTERYLQWYMGMHGWYSFHHSMLEKISPPCLFLHYEKLYAAPRRRQEFNRITEFLNVPQISERQLSPMKKQDANLNWFSKIDNNGKALDLDFSLGYDFFNSYFVPDQR